MAKVIKKTIEHHKTETIFWILLALITVFLLAYLYLLKLAVFSAYEIKNNQKTLSAVNAERQKLERLYLDRITKFDTNYAKTLGFTEQKNKIDYITREISVAKR